MELTIKVSEVMDRESSWNEYYERRIIRVPEVARNYYNFRKDEFIHLIDAKGKHITLQVAEAFKEDVMRNPMAGYVTTHVYDKLLLRDAGIGNVQPVTGITLGCDPEAFLIDGPSNHIVAAYRFMRKYGDVGHDGILIEFRPMPSTDENVVVHNIYNLVKKARKLINSKPDGPNVRIIGRSGLQGLTAGFHLHYGLPQRLLGRHQQTRILAQLMTRACDYYIGVPSIIPEGDNDAIRRTLPYVDYGKPGGYRLDNRTFEYRMPGGVNLKHPCLTRGLMALGAVVVEDLVSRINIGTDFFSNLSGVATEGDIRELYPNLPDLETIYAIICNPNISPARNYFQSIKEDVRKMVGYKQRASSIESYFKCLENSIQFDENLEVNWGGNIHEEQQRQMVVL